MNTSSEATSIMLQVNGESQSCAEGTTLPQLLIQLAMDPRLVAVEYNGEILHRQFWETTVMQTNDRLEVVTIVGGG
ncbi:thiamine biosynthesis protein ThiS [Leptolyngbya sp. PCC 7375]|nr:thiamine biosynthesis protein ThiS [Leptolyngbya sp. PCC 7375]